MPNCVICGRESRGFCRLENKRLVYFCSTTCELCKVIDLTPNEQQAIKHGSQMAIEYLTELGNWNLADVSHDQFLQLCTCVVTGYCESMQRHALRETEFLMGLQK